MGKCHEESSRVTRTTCCASTPERRACCSEEKQHTFSEALGVFFIAGVTCGLSAPVSGNRGVRPEDYFAFEFIGAAHLRNGV